MKVCWAGVSGLSDQSVVTSLIVSFIIVNVGVDSCVACLTVVVVGGVVVIVIVVAVVG